MTLVFTNGCFDLIHPGHVSLLRFARNLGDRLVVGLNSDASVARIKSGRPIQTAQARQEILLAIRWVDRVVVFEEDTPERLVRDLKPDVLVKGDDWIGKEVAGADFVRSRGGFVAFFPILPGFSTTALVEKAAPPKET
jgi:D-beta-D-heptose 7-phosphate kinase/D-beta-D-heptose 1-phosphate adenosyltransferase